MKFSTKRNFSLSMNKFPSITNYNIVTSASKYEKLGQSVSNKKFKSFSNFTEMTNLKKLKNIKNFKVNSEYIGMRQTFNSQFSPPKVNKSSKNKQLRLKLIDTVIMKIKGTRINLPKEIKSATLSPKSRIPLKFGFELNQTNEKIDSLYKKESKDFQQIKKIETIKKINFMNFQNKYQSKLNFLKEIEQFPIRKYFKTLGKMLKDVGILVPQIVEVLNEYMNIFHYLIQSLNLPDYIKDFSKLINQGRNVTKISNSSTIKLNNIINYVDHNEKFLNKYESDLNEMKNIYKKSEGVFNTSSPKDIKNSNKNYEASAEDYNFKKMATQKKLIPKGIPRLSLNQISKNSIDFNTEFMSHFNEFSDSWRELSKQLK